MIDMALYFPAGENRVNGISAVLKAYPLLERDLEEVRDVIRRSLQSGIPDIDAGLARFVENPGKMLRPAMVLLSARMGDFDAGRIYRLAAAVELLHIATLIHDDIIDDSPLRRGISTIHSLEGVRKAVLFGDYLFTRCFQLTADFASPEAARNLAGVVGRICESEIAQTRSNGESLRVYLRKSAGKTALLFLASASMGAEESGCSPETVSALRWAAYGIGMGFQIIDDILDYTGKPNDLGKPTGSDVKGGLATLPLILAMRMAEKTMKPQLDKPVNRRRAARIREFVMNEGGLEAAQSYAEFYSEQASKALTSLPDCESRNALILLSQTLRERWK